jgi:outer membrane protein TolC
MEQSDMERMLLPLLVATCLTLPQSAMGQQATDTLYLETALVLARETNPMLQATRLRADAAAERIPQAAAWSDPMLSFGLMNRVASNFGASVPMSQNTIQLTQRFPWPGKLGFSKERERRLTEAERLDSEESEFALLARVKAVYYRLAFVDRSIAIMEETRGLLRNLQDVSSGMYAVGTAQQQDVLRAQVSVAQMTEDITVMEQNRVAMGSRLNALLGRDATEIVGALELPQVGDELPSAEDLFALAKAQRPALRAAEERTQAADAGYRAARRSLYPDVNVTVGYGHRPDFEDLTTVMVGFSLPVFAGSRQLPLRREMQARTAVAEAMVLDLNNETYARLAELRAEAERASNLSTLYATSVLPQAEAAVEAAFSAYRVGSVDFQTLVQNQLTVNRYAIEQVQLVADYHTAVAGISALIGQNLEEENE